MSDFSPQWGSYYDKNNVKLFRKFIYFVVKFLYLSPKTMLLDAIHRCGSALDARFECREALFSGRGGRATGGGVSGGPLIRRVRLFVPSRLSPVRPFVFFRVAFPASAPSKLLSCLFGQNIFIVILRYLRDLCNVRVFRRFRPSGLSNGRHPQLLGATSVMVSGGLFYDKCNGFWLKSDKYNDDDKYNVFRGRNRLVGLSAADFRVRASFCLRQV